MKKLGLVIFSFGLLLLLPTEISASSLVAVNRDGQIVLNVLSSQDSLALKTPKRDSLEVVDVAGSETSDGKISLMREGAKVNLSIAGSGGETNLDVTGITSEIIEVEERPQTQRIQISLEGENFVITQEGVSAITSFPIIVNPKTAELSVTTDTGVKYVAVLPSAAVESVLRAKIINNFPKGSKITLGETDGVLAYKISGEKILNLFNMMDYPVAVESVVSASNGEILKTNQPAWLQIISFMFS